MYFLHPKPSSRNPEHLDINFFKHYPANQLFAFMCLQQLDPRACLARFVLDLLLWGVH